MNQTCLNCSFWHFCLSQLTCCHTFSSNFYFPIWTLFLKHFKMSLGFPGAFWMSYTALDVNKIKSASLTYWNLPNGIVGYFISTLAIKPQLLYQQENCTVKHWPEGIKTATNQIKFQLLMPQTQTLKHLLERLTGAGRSWKPRNSHSPFFQPLRPKAKDKSDFAVKSPHELSSTAGKLHQHMDPSFSSFLSPALSTIHTELPKLCCINCQLIHYH